MRTLTRVQPARRLTIVWPDVPPWLPGAFVALMAGMTLLMPALNQDLGWHLRTGNLILRAHAIPNADPYSFTRQGNPWVDHEWLWQVAMSLLDGVFGAMGIVLVNAALASTAAWLVYLRGRASGLPALYATAGAALSWLVSAFIVEARPSLVVAPFCAATLYCLDRFRQSRRAGWLISLLPLEAIWANVHASYVLGLLICALYLGAAVWERHLRRVRALAALMVGLLVASAANPLGFELLRFTLFASRLRFNRQFILEWQHPPFAQPVLWPLLGCILASAAFTVALQAWKGDKARLLLTIACTGAVLYSMQSLLLYAVAISPAIAGMAFELAPRQAERVSPPSAALLVATAVLYALAMPVRQLAPAAYARAFAQSYPVQAVQFIQQSHLVGPMWNEFQWGGYLIGALPRTPVFVDGRTELYGDDFLYQYEAAVSGKAAPQPLLDRYAINFALVKANSLIAEDLRRDPCWRQVYSDELSAVLTRAC